MNKVDQFWNNHTVNSENNGFFNTKEEHVAYMNWRFEELVQFKDLMALYDGYDDMVVVDYGSGPGEDVIGFLIQSNAQKVIGIDISMKAIDLLKHKIKLHEVEDDKYKIIHASDTSPSIPLESESVDYIHSQGVLHHTSNPKEILEEFYRILKSNSKARIMVYNYNSLFVHQYVAYFRMIERCEFKNQTLEEAFRQSTDTLACPVSIYYKPEDFIELCNSVGFTTEFKGGFYNRTIEGVNAHKFRKKALENPSLDQKHKDFIASVTFDEGGYAIYDDKAAGIGGVYELSK
jgi:ubiquinone/menaquinone biosynthesis C-methylase UbiE